MCRAVTPACMKAEDQVEDFTGYVKQFATPIDG
jgi:hypothetical protein